MNRSSGRGEAAISGAPTPPVVRLGIGSGVATAACSVAFTGAAVLTEARLLNPPWDLILPIVPSLVLAPAFLVMLTCVHSSITGNRRIWSQLGVVFAAVYVPLCAAAYIVELFVVEPRVLGGAASEVALLTLTRGDTILNAVDGIGYIFMCMATLFAAPAFGAGGLERWIRRLFFGNAILAVPIFLTYFVDRSFIYLAAPWSVTISCSAILIALYFHRLAHCRRSVSCGMPIG